MTRRIFSGLLLVLATLFAPAGFAEAGKSATVLITGANRGIGLELARQFNAKGYSVIGTARKPSEADALAGLAVRVEQLDVTDAASVAALAASLEGAPIDILINNAGTGGQGVSRIADADFEQMAWTFEVNSIGPMRITQALLPNLAAGKGKTVVSVSSIMGSIENNQGGYYGYRASKAALNQLNMSLSRELGGQGFTCVVVHPGWVKTRMGGAQAPVEVQDSVAGLVAVIEGLEPGDNGRFIDYQGNALPW